MSNTYTPTSTTDHQDQPTTQNTKIMSIMAFIFNGIGLLILPLLFGAVAAAFAGIGLSKGEGTIAKWALGVSVANMLFGAVAILVVLDEFGYL